MVTSAKSRLPGSSFQLSIKKRDKRKEVKKWTRVKQSCVQMEEPRKAQCAFRERTVANRLSEPDQAPPGWKVELA